MRHVTLVIVFNLNFFGTKTRYYLQNLIGYNHFLLYNKQKLLRMHIFLKITPIAKKRVSESGQHHALVQRSRKICGLLVVTKSHYMRRLWMTVF